LFARPSEAREEFELKETRSVPPPAARLRRVLEFKFFSRTMAASNLVFKFAAQRDRTHDAAVAHIKV
jgi:hypothetical protein